MNSQIDHLIIKRCQDRISSAESDSLDKWIAESADNRRYYDETVNAFQFSIFPDTQQIPALKLNLKRLETKHSLSYTIIRIAALVSAVFAIAYMVRVPSKTDLIVTDKIQNYTLPDGSEITMNVGSHLVFDTDFNTDSRTVHLNGEAYFKVQRSQLPFIIETNQHEVEVLGTSFNVKNNGDTTIVEVSNGRVKLSNNSKSLVLIGGQSGKSFGKEVNISEVKLADYEIADWRSPFWTFRDTPLKDIFAFLEKQYHAKISVEDQSIQELRIYANFSKESLEKILESIAGLHRLSIQKKQSDYLIERIK